jgi:hypothetical protein
MADEGSLGGLGGMGAGAALGFALGGPAGALMGAGIGGTGGGLIGGLFAKKPKAPDISGELAKISALFEQLRAQNRVNINRDAAQGRTAAANNMATRGTYRSGVSNVGFNALEDSRLNALANSDAQLAGTEAGVRADLLGKLLGLNSSYQMMGAQSDAARTGAITGLAGNLLLNQLLKSGGGGFGAPRMTSLPASNYNGIIA